VRPYIPFLLIFFTGTFLRFHALDRQSLWDDELSTLHTISAPSGQFIHQIENSESHPPLYFLQLKIWEKCHCRSLVRLRANSAFWGSISLLLIFLLGRQYGGESLGLLAMMLLATSPFHLAYSQELRSYALAVAIALAGWLNLERTISGKHGSLPLQILLWTAQLYTHYWGAFVVLAQICYGLWKVQLADRKRVLIAGALSGLLFSPWVPIFLQQLATVNQLTFWASPFSIKGLGKVFLAFSGLYFNMASSIFYMRSIVGGFVGIGLLFAAALGLGIWRGPRAAFFWLVIGLGIPWGLSAWRPSIFLWYRYTVLMLPAFVILVSSGFLAMRPRWLAGVLIMVAIGAQTWAVWTYFHGWQKANPKAVVAYVHRIRQSDSVVVCPSYFGELFNFYDLGTTRVLDEDILDSPEKRAALRGHHAIFVGFDVPSDPVGDALIREYNPVTARYFPGTAHLGITVYQLE
jgi:mannosyltransferase